MNDKIYFNKDDKEGKTLPIILFVLCIFGVFFLFSSFNNNNKAVVDKDEPKKVLKVTDLASYQSNFASYREVAVNFDPQVPHYEVASDFSNVTNYKDFYFQNNQEIKDLLLENGFFVDARYYETEFFPLYESNRSDYVPNFITTDSMLHNYHLMFAYLLRKVEERKLIGELKSLNKEMLAGALEQHEKVKGTEWEEAAVNNVAFFAVGSKLLDPSINLPQVGKSLAEQELTLIKEKKGISLSPLMASDYMEDYTQYIPRGHYEKSSELTRYFLSMMWYGRMSFVFEEEKHVRSAVLITLLVDKNKDSWEKLYEPINFFVGKSDDIGYYDFYNLIDNVYGSVGIDRVLSEKDKFVSFKEEVKRFDPPKINSMPIFDETITPDKEEAIKSFRFMGQRYTIDADIFQRLIHREVSQRMLPKGLDIPAAMGSEDALKILEEKGETKYGNYSNNMSKARNYLKALPQNVWTQNLYFGWLYQLQPLLEEKGKGYPVFMQNDAWKRKELNTFLGSWSQLKHDTILYAKQVYAEMGGYFPEEADDRGYVEPNPYVYARIASLLDMTIEGLESRGLLENNIKETIIKMRELALSLKVISEKELNNQALTDDEYELIRSYGGQLEHLWLEFNKEDIKSSVSNYLNENNIATIADVATDPNGSVLEVGVGGVHSIYVIVPVDGKLKIAKGGVYSYYEFPWPMNDRLTDSKWREMISSEEGVDLPDWTKSYRFE